MVSLAARGHRDCSCLPGDGRNTVSIYRKRNGPALVCDPELQRCVQQVSIRKLAKAAEVTENTVKAARRGDRLQRSTVNKLRKALELTL
jgi:hypothetical protein